VIPPVTELCVAVTEFTSGADKAMISPISSVSCEGREGNVQGEDRKVLILPTLLQINQGWKATEYPVL